MKTYRSIEPLLLEELLLKSRWWLNAQVEGSIIDGQGNEAYATQLDDGHLQLDVDEDNDVSELRDRFGFERVEPEDA